jgi:hypothetical protein
MRRCVLIILLLVYPFQVALAMADRCCVTTPAGVTHHSVTQGAAAATPVFVADDDGPALSDPHCPACVFGHILYLPSDVIVFASQRHHALAIVSTPPFLASPPAARPERPKWRAAADTSIQAARS